MKLGARLYSAPFTTIIMIAAVLSVEATQSRATLTVEITGATTSSEGSVIASLWRAGDTFLKGRAYKSVSTKQRDGKAFLVFNDLEPGEYAVSAFQDVNSNGRLDTGFMGKPTEPYGFSNDARRMFGPPKFDEAKIELNAPGRTISFRLK